MFMRIFLQRIFTRKQYLYNQAFFLMLFTYYKEAIYLSLYANRCDMNKKKPIMHINAYINKHTNLASLFSYLLISFGHKSHFLKFESLGTFLKSAKALITNKYHKKLRISRRIVVKIWKLKIKGRHKK